MTNDAPRVPAVRRLVPAAESWTEERCHSVELSNDAADPSLSIARARVEPGVTTRWRHLVDTTERYVIVDGEATVELGDDPPRAMRRRDVAIIPPLCRQRIANTGTTDLVFLAICSSRFRQDNDRDVDAVSHASTIEP